MTMKANLTLHLMVGNIGTGKSVTTKHLTLELDNTLVIDIDAIVTMLSLDNYGPAMFTEKHQNLYNDLLRTMTGRLLTHGFNVIVDTTMMSRKKRANFINIAKQHNAIVKVYLHKTPGGLERRCADGRGYSDKVWKDIYKMFEAEYEEPSLNEGIDEIIDCTWGLNGPELKTA